MTAVQSETADLRSLTDEDLLAQYGCDRFTATIMASRLRYIVNHVCDKLLRNAFSPIIRDAHDFTATIAGGPALDFMTPAVAQTLPLFFGSMRDAVANSLTEYGLEELREGDLIVCNDTFRAGTHPNDTCFIRPVFHDGTLVSAITIRAHMLDMGGSVPGGFSGLKPDIYVNGLIIPPMLLFRENRPVRATFSIIFDNTRFGQLLLPDMYSILHALEMGEGLVHETIDRYGVDAYLGGIRYACDASAERSRNALRDLPDGVYEGEDYLDADGLDPDREYRVAVKITKRGDRAEVDFSGTSVQAQTCMNSCWPDTKTSVSVALKALLDPTSPYTSAFMRNIDLVVPSGSLVASEPPAASMMYMEPILCAMSAVLNALNPVVGDRGHATGSRCTQVHQVISPVDAATPWMTVLYPIGAWGANAAGDADSGQLSLVLNFLGPDVETLEAEIPVVHVRKEYVTDSGGAGRFRGGAGTVEDTFWPTSVTHFMTVPRTKTPNGQGAAGGHAGGAVGVWYWSDVQIDRDNLRDPRTPSVGRSTPVSGVLDPSTLEMHADGEYFHWAARAPWVTDPHSLWRTLSDGGGGWGDPHERDPESVLRDVRDGYVSLDGAARDYGVVVSGDPERDPEGIRVDTEATTALRGARAVKAEGTASREASHGVVAAALAVDRTPVDGDCDACGEASLAEYPVLSEIGWLRVVKCQNCLHSASRTAWRRLGSIQLAEDAL